MKPFLQFAELLSFSRDLRICLLLPKCPRLPEVMLPGAGATQVKLREGGDQKRGEGSSAAPNMRGEQRAWEGTGLR